MRVSFRIEGANIGLSVVIEAIGFIVGDDDGALRPILAVGDGVDLIGADPGITSAAGWGDADDRQHAGRSLGGCRREGEKLSVRGVAYAAD